jgi:hypothetical protein
MPYLTYNTVFDNTRHEGARGKPALPGLLRPAQVVPRAQVRVPLRRPAPEPR